MESMAQAARVGQGEIHLVCHRAFDQTVDQTSTLHMLEGLGFHRVLTSGGASTALQGAAKIRSLQKSTSLDLVPAGGVNASSIVEVVSKTGCRSVHGTFRNQSGGSGTGIRMSVSELRGAMKITGHGATGT
jgi:copper homeostasis protein